MAVLTSAKIKSKAIDFGFDLCGIARAARHPKLERLTAWLDAGCAGDMGYLRESLDERLDIAVALPGARSVISLAVVYNTSPPCPAEALEPGAVAIARYAWGEDYHDVLRSRVRGLLQWMNTEHGPGLEAFSCVDDGPVQERVFAEQAGLGWIGKNTCLINPRLGSWLFLAEIACNLELDVDTPGFDQCGTCTRCLDACPTAAITEPYTVDATRCLSYVTIETRSRVAEDMRGKVSSRVFGCDICQDVCPWNRRAPESDDVAWQARDELLYPRLIDLCVKSDEAWRRLIKGSALRRAGLRRLRRSLAYAAVHLPPQQATAALDALHEHPSSSYAEVTDAIRWGKKRVEEGREDPSEPTRSE